MPTLYISVGSGNCYKPEPALPYTALAPAALARLSPLACAPMLAARIRSTAQKDQ